MRKSNHGGSILLLTALFSFVFFLLALVLIRILPAEFHSAKKARQDTVAHYVAEAGVKSAIVWLEGRAAEVLLTQEVLNEEFNSRFLTPKTLAADWTYDARVDQNPAGNRYFDIVANAYFRGRHVRQIRTTVEREGFNSYALFIDTWPDDLVYGLGNEGLTGPFHTNQFFRLAVEDPSFWAGAGTPFVDGNFARMTHAQVTTQSGLPFDGDGNAYYRTATAINDDEGYVPFDAEGAIENRYQRIVSGGRGNLQVVPEIPLPSSDEQLLQKAWGADNDNFVLPSELGVYVNNDGTRVLGGVLAQGNVELELRLDPAGNQIQRFTMDGFDRYYRYSVTNPQMFPIYEFRVVEGLVPEVVEVERVETVLELVGYEEQLVVNANGINEIIEVPIYEPRERTVIVMVETGNMIPGTEGALVQVGEESRDVEEFFYVSEEEYNENPTAYPNAMPVFLEGEDQITQVVEVTEEAGYTIAAGQTVDGEPLPSDLLVEAHNTVVVEPDGNHLVHQGDLNGVTYVNGNIESLRGTSKGHAEEVGGETRFDGRILTANLRAGRTITLTGDLLQFYGGDDAERQHDTRRFTLAPGELSPNTEHVLGIITQNVWLHPTNRNQTIYGVILAGRRAGNNSVGGFGVHADLLQSGGLGQFRLFGGVIEATAEPWIRAGNGLRGQLIYDPAAAEGLPLFPQTPSFTTLRYVEGFPG